MSEKKNVESLKFNNISIYTVDGRHNHYDNVVIDYISVAQGNDWIAVNLKEGDRVDMYNLNNVCAISISEGDIQNE